MNDVEHRMQVEYRAISYSIRELAHRLYELYREGFNKYCAPNLSEWSELDYKTKLIWTHTAKGVKHER